MKRSWISLIFASSVFLFGCSQIQAFIHTREAEIRACKEDAGLDGVKDTADDCTAQAKAWQDKGKVIGGIVGGTGGSLVPGGAVIGQKVGETAGGYLFLTLASMILGHAILKKKVIQPVQ